MATKTPSTTEVTDVEAAMNGLDGSVSLGRGAHAGAGAVDAEGVASYHEKIEHAQGGGRHD